MDAKKRKLEVENAFGQQAFAPHDCDACIVCGFGFYAVVVALTVRLNHQAEEMTDQVE